MYLSLYSKLVIYLQRITSSKMLPFRIDNEEELYDTENYGIFHQMS